MTFIATVKVSRSHLIRMRIASADDLKPDDLYDRRFATPFSALIYEMVEVRANSRPLKLPIPPTIQIVGQEV